MRLISLIAIASAFLLILGVGWVGAELHYRNCLSGVEMHYPVAYQPGSPGSGNKYIAPSEPRAHFVISQAGERAAALAGCSRLP
jgi:hypothetical protein